MHLLTTLDCKLSVFMRYRILEGLKCIELLLQLVSLHRIELMREWSQKMCAWNRFDSLVTYLHHFVKIGEGLMLVHLSHSKFLNQKLLNFFKLIYLQIKSINIRNTKCTMTTYLIIYFWDLIDPFFLQHLVILALLVLNYSLTFKFHMCELTFILINLIPESSLSIVLWFFISYSSVKEAFLFLDHHSLDSHCSLSCL